LFKNIKINQALRNEPNNFEKLYLASLSLQVALCYQIIEYKPPVTALTQPKPTAVLSDH